MRKYLLMWLFPVLLASTTVDSTEIPIELSNQEKYELTRKEYQPHFTQIPANPNIRKEVPTFLDSNLTQVDKIIKPNQSLKIIDILVNDKNQQVFQLDNDRYILADTEIVYDDQILASTPVQQTYWLPSKFTVYSSPISNQAKTKKTNLKSYQKVSVSEIVQTNWDLFAKVDGQGWIKVNELSENDNRMEAVQNLLNQKYNSPKLAVYVKQLSTGLEVGVNQNKKMYAASVTKLPILYYVQEQLNTGKYNLSQGLQYINAVDDYNGAYKPEGSGNLTKIPDNRHYKISELIDKTAKLSDNVASNILGYYMTNKNDAAYNQTITKIAGENWDMKSRMASAQMAGHTMEAIYHQNGYVLQSLIGTNFDQQRIAKNIPVNVAHKIGDAYDNKHDVAVVYAESPFILSIFTDQSDYETISQIADDVYRILK